MGLFGGKEVVGSVEVGAPAKDGEGRARRCFIDPEKLVEGKDAEIRTVWDIIQRSGRLFPDQNGFGYRTLIQEHVDEKEVTKMVKGKEVKEMKKWTYYEMSDYEYLSYREIEQQVRQVGSGLRSLGMEKGKMFNIFAATAPNWQLMACGCASQSITFATAYDSLGEEGLTHSLNEPEVVGIFTNGNLLPTLAKVITQTPTVKVVVYDGKDVKADLLETIKNANGGVKVIHIDELKQLGAKENIPPTPPSENDLCCIMYTSGSTGAPKGVLLTHRNVCASVAAVKVLLVHLLKPSESYIAYLPLAHIFEFVVELIMMYHAIPCGFGNPKTLSDTSMRNCKGDMRTFKPSIMVGVPAVWEQIRKGILTKVKDEGKEGIFNVALTLKRRSSLLAPLVDAVVFKKVKEATGGRLRYALSGGAPISYDTQQFLQTALVTMLQGYGMTESAAMCVILPPEYLASGHSSRAAGLPVPCSEIKLLDQPEMQYTSKNNPPQGEVCVRGPSITNGYFKRPDLDKELFTEDGYLRTGDIGQWNPDGTLSIIDRIKNLVKLSGGEYIALEKLETTYGACNLVTKICLHADPNASKPMAIIFPNEKNLRSAASSQGFAANEDFKTLCEDDKVHELVLKELNGIAKKSGFKPLEQIQSVVLDSEEWTPQNGMLTPAQKLSRKTIVKKFEQEIKKNYP